MAIRIYPYRDKSRSAHRLAALLKGVVLKKSQTILPNKWDVVINWGSSECPYTESDGCRILNNRTAIKTAANKRAAFLVMKEGGVSVPRFCVSISDVSWEGLTVVRHKLTGHSGEGIELVENKDDLPDAPLYVEYVKKQDEYRIHVIGSDVTTIQRKGARNDFDGTPDFKVRNHKNGFVFVRNGEDGGPIVPPKQVLDQAVLAVGALGLDFGAVDIIYNQAAKKAYVLECNTAPGMEGSTINEYAEGFKRLLGDKS